MIVSYILHWIDDKIKVSIWSGNKLIKILFGSYCDSYVEAIH